MTPLESTREILAALVGYPTISLLPNRDLIAHAAQLLEDAGARIHIFENEAGQANLFATIGPEADGGVVLSGHSDVVPPGDGGWSGDPFILREQDGLLYGRGSCDMKGFIAAAVAMAPHYAALPLRRPVHFAFTYDEEVGCLGAQRLVQDLKHIGVRPSAAIIGEPTEMRIIEAHKAVYEYATEFTGLEGHASEPDAGVNAIHSATRYMAKLLELEAEMKGRTPAGSPFSPPWTTLQIGRIEGGVMRNVIARQCCIDWEMRPVTRADADHVRSALHVFCEEVLLPPMRAVHRNASIVTRTIGEVEGLEPAALNEARDIVAELTGANGADVVAFGTEAGLFQSLGMSAVVCGPGSIAQAHKPDEYVSIDQLGACLTMLGKLGDRLCR